MIVSRQVNVADTKPAQYCRLVAVIFWQAVEILLRRHSLTCLGSPPEKDLWSAEHM